MGAATDERTSEQVAQEKEKAAQEERERQEREEKAEQEALEAAADQLQLPVGGIRDSGFAVQVTGGELMFPAKAAGTFKKDEEVDVVIAGYKTTAWVKTVKSTTEKKGGRSTRTAILVLEQLPE